MEEDNKSKMFIALNMKMLGQTKQEATAELEKYRSIVDNVHKKINRDHEKLGIPSNIDTPLFPFQDRSDEFDLCGEAIADRYDMYQFFKANSVLVTYKGTVELNGVSFDPLSYRGYDPISDALLSTDQRIAAERCAQAVSDTVKSHGGEVLPAKDGSVFYMRVKGNADMFLALAKLQGSVSAIGLFGYPSNFTPKDIARTQKRKRARLAPIRRLLKATRPKGAPSPIG